MNLAVIPARGDSRRIPKKNIRDFFGRPIISYSIDAARSSRLFDAVHVSTDNTEIALVASAYGAQVYRRKNPHDDTVGTQRRVVEVMADLQEKFDYACCVYATAPLMNAVDLKLAYNELVEQDLDFVYVEGWFYWGKAQAFVEDRPLFGPKVRRIEIPERWVDINTEDDWKRAQKMYEALA